MMLPSVHAVIMSLASFHAKESVMDCNFTGASFNTGVMYKSLLESRNASRRFAVPTPYCGSAKHGCHKRTTWRHGADTRRPTRTEDSSIFAISHSCVRTFPMGWPVRTSNSRTAAERG